MRHGIDTGFMVAAEVVEHADHASARMKLAELLAAAYRQAGVQSLLTTNPSDFAVFADFTWITPVAAAARQ